MSWSTVSLGEAVAFRGGGTPSRGNPSYWGGSIPWATVKDLNSGYALRTTQEFITEEGLQRSASNLIPAGTVIIPTRMALGKAVMSEVDVAINQDLKAAIPIKELDTRFLLWFFLANSSRIEAMGKGATVKGVTLDQLRSLEIPLPPIAEQRRIAAILDKADALRAKRREAIAKLDQLLQCVFIDMFGDPVTNPKGLSELSLGELVSSTKIGLVRSANEFGEDFDIPYVRMDAVSADGKFLPDKVKKTSASESEMSDYALEPGDFLFNTRNSKELVGKTCVYNGPPGWTFNNNLMRIRFKEGVASSVIAMQFQFGRVKRELEKRKSGTTSVYAVYWRELQSLPLLLPPASQQQKFAAIKAKIEAHRRALQRHGTQFDNLFASVQQRAFAGTL